MFMCGISQVENRQRIVWIITIAIHCWFDLATSLRLDLGFQMSIFLIRCVHCVAFPFCPEHMEAL